MPGWGAVVLLRVTCARFLDIRLCAGLLAAGRRFTGCARLRACHVLGWVLAIVGMHGYRAGCVYVFVHLKTIIFDGQRYPTIGRSRIEALRMHHGFLSCAECWPVVRWWRHGVVLRIASVGFGCYWWGGRGWLVR